MQLDQNSLTIQPINPNPIKRQNTSSYSSDLQFKQFKPLECLTVNKVKKTITCLDHIHYFVVAVVGLGSL